MIFRSELVKDVTSQFYSMGNYCSVELNQKTLNSIVSLMIFNELFMKLIDIKLLISY